MMARLGLAVSLLLVSACADPPQLLQPASAAELSTAVAGDTVSVWLTHGDRSALLTSQPRLTFGTGANKHANIVVDAGQPFQLMDGFGYTLTGGSAIVINRMPAASRDALLRELFTPGTATLGISYLRLSLGASDLSAYPFTYNEVPQGQTDPELVNFSLAEDEKELIPVLKQILAINPGIQLMATPWTAPRWMKTQYDYVGGSLRREWFGSYARYILKYLQAMQAHGITIHALTVQNEPLHAGNNPSMYMTAAEQADFVKDHLGPTLRSAGFDTKIILYDHNADHPEYPISILNDPGAKAYADGSAFHLYAGDISALSQVRNAHPDRNLYFTEQWTGANGHFGNDLRWHIRHIITGAPNNWCRVVLEWNLATDQSYGPHTSGGCSSCLGAVTIHSISHAVTRNVSYYIIGHASRYVTPGSVRIGSSVTNASKTTNLVHVAFRTPAGRHVLIAMNDGKREETFNIRVGSVWATHTLRVGSVATYLW